MDRFLYLKSVVYRRSFCLPEKSRKKIKIFFQSGQKLSTLDFRITPRTAKGGVIGYDGKRTQTSDTRSIKRAQI